MYEVFLIPIKKTDKATSYSVTELYEEIFYWLNYQVKKLCTGKTNAVVLDFIFDSSSDGWADEEGVYISFRNSGGMCEMSANVALHWFTLTYHLIHAQLVPIAEKMGYSLGPIKEGTLAYLLEHTPHHPVVKIKSKYYSIYSTSETTFELYGDNEMLDVTTLAKAALSKITKQMKERTCQCSLCVKMKKGAYQSIGLAALKAKEGLKTDYTTFSSAIRNPRSVERLYLNEIDSDQIISEKLGLLKHLEMLYVYDNRFLEQIPKEIGQLQRLRALQITSNLSLKELPIELFDCKRLESLKLDTLSLPELPAAIKNLKNLTSLDYDSNGMNGPKGRVPKEIGTLNKLKDVTLRNIENEIPKTLYTCTNLESLCFSKCNLNQTVPTELGQLKKLKYLRLMWSNISTLGSVISQLTNLESLGLSRNPISTEELEQIDFSTLKKLTTLDLSGTLITRLPESIWDLKNLTYLSLSQTNLTELDERIGQLKKLETLYIYDTNLTSLPESLKQIKGLTNLNIKNTNIENVSDSLQYLL